MSNFGEIVNSSYFESHYSLYYELTEKQRYAINKILLFAISSKGAIVDETIDLYLILSDVVRNGDHDYSLDDVESILSIGSELAIFNYIKDKQTLVALEIGEDSPVYAAAINEDDIVLEAAICLSSNPKSKFNNNETLAALSLFGTWESKAVSLIKCLIDSNKLSGKLTKIKAGMELEGIHFPTDVAYVDFLRKLYTVKLIDIKTSKLGAGEIHLNVASAGMLLVLSENIDLARKLSALTS